MARPSPVPPPSSDTSPSDPSSLEWKREANHRLAMHRARRDSRAVLQSALPGMEEAIHPADPPSSAKDKSVAARVAARYAKAPSYSEMLANEARNAARAAEAAAVAAGAARDAAQAILVGLDMDIQADEAPPPAAARELPPTPRAMGDSQTRHSPSLHSPSLHSPSLHSPSLHSPSLHSPSLHSRTSSLIIEAEDEEELNPFHEQEPVAAIQPLPAKLIEFPRELVATRKARPRLAEGPLREEYDRDEARSQLRIFEVEAETISRAPELEPALPEWSPIRLDAPELQPAQEWVSHRAAEAMPRPAASTFELPLQTASIEDRLMAALVDAALIAGGILIFVLVFVACTVHPPTGNAALIGGGVASIAFAAIYLLLFFSFGTDTPGMRYAKIALCTFDDENPTRKAMRRRLAALLLALLPLGLGILWAIFDDDRLGWHDRISRTYQRSYR